jgi:hypothetical protein
MAEVPAEDDGLADEGAGATQVGHGEPAADVDSQLTTRAGQTPALVEPAHDAATTHVGHEGRPRPMAVKK